MLKFGNEIVQVTRNLNKYEKKLKGKVTTEAKTDLDFHNHTKDESLNGTTRKWKQMLISESDSVLLMTSY